MVTLWEMRVWDVPHTWPAAAGAVGGPCHTPKPACSLENRPAAQSCVPSSCTMSQALCTPHTRAAVLRIQGSRFAHPEVGA